MHNRGRKKMLGKGTDAREVGSKRPGARASGEIARTHDAWTPQKLFSHINTSFNVFSRRILIGKGGPRVLDVGE